MRKGAAEAVEMVKGATAMAVRLDPDLVIGEILACETPEAYGGSDRAGVARKGEQPQP